MPEMTYAEATILNAQNKRIAELEAQLAEARELLDDLEWKPDMFAFITTHMHEGEWIKRYEALAGNNAATASSGTDEEKER